MTTSTKTIKLEVHDSGQILSKAKLAAEQIFGKTGSVKDIRLISKGTQGFWGIGAKPKQYEVELENLKEADIQALFAATESRDKERQNIAIEVMINSAAPEIWSKYNKYILPLMELLKFHLNSSGWREFVREHSFLTKDESIDVIQNCLAVLLKEAEKRNPVDGDAYRKLSKRLFEVNIPLLQNFSKEECLRANNIVQKGVDHLKLVEISRGNFDKQNENFEKANEQFEAALRIYKAAGIQKSLSICFVCYEWELVEDFYKSSTCWKCGCERRRRG